MKKAFKWVGLGILLLIVVVVLLGFRGSGKFSGLTNMEEKFIISNPLDLSQISSISKFRSCVGHDYSGYNTGGEREKLRTMKHYITAINTLENSTGKLAAFSPFDGKIRSIEGDAGPENWQRGWQVWLEPDAADGWFFIFFHIDLLEGFKKGSEIKAGELIGYGNVKDAANFDMIVKASNGLRGPSTIDSPFLHMTSDVLKEYSDVGVTLENIILSKEYRDADDCPIKLGTESKNDTIFESRGDEIVEDWVVLD